MEKVLMYCYKGGSWDWFMFDLGLATQTLCLSAQSQGLGTVIIGLFNHDKVKEILFVPEGYEIVALIPIGYPAQKPSAPRRKEIGDFFSCGAIAKKYPSPQINIFI